MFFTTWDGVQLQLRTHSDSDAIMLLAHPYGPLGGNYNNNVVRALERAAHRHHYSTVAYNARGCGQSEGRTTFTMASEVKDYAALVTALAEGTLPGLPKATRLLLMGYSYGALTASAAYSALTLPVPVSLLLVSPPLPLVIPLTCFAYRTWPTLPPHACTVMGTRDQFCSADRYTQWCADNHLAPHLIHDADHFWFDHENTLMSVVNHLFST